MNVFVKTHFRLNCCLRNFRPIYKHRTICLLRSSRCFLYLAVVDNELKLVSSVDIRASVRISASSGIHSHVATEDEKLSSFTDAGL